MQGDANYPHPLWATGRNGQRKQGPNKARGANSHQSYHSCPTPSYLHSNRYMLWLDPVWYPEPQRVMERLHLSKAGPGVSVVQFCQAGSDCLPWPQGWPQGPEASYKVCTELLPHPAWVSSHLPTGSGLASSHGSAPLAAHSAFLAEPGSSPATHPFPAPG